MEASGSSIPKGAVEVFSDGTRLITDRWQKLLRALVPLNAIVLGLTFVMGLVVAFVVSSAVKFTITDGVVHATRKPGSGIVLLVVAYLVFVFLLLIVSSIYVGASYHAVAAEALDQETSPSRAWNFGRQNFRRVFLSMLLFAAIVVVSVIVVAALSSVSSALGNLAAILLLAAWIYFVVRLMPFFVVLLNERLDPVAAINRTMAVTSDKWTHCFGVGILGLLAAIAVYFVVGIFARIPVLGIIVSLANLLIISPLVAAWYASVQEQLYINLRSAYEPTTFGVLQPLLDTPEFPAGA
jgi:hypothetical protein